MWPFNEPNQQGVTNAHVLRPRCRTKNIRAYKRKMSRSAFMILFLLTIPRVVEARTTGQETLIRPMLICENHTRSVDARDCIEQPRAQKQLDAAPVVTSNRFWRER